MNSKGDIAVRMRGIADDLMMGAPPDALAIAAQDLYMHADELDATGNSTTRSLITMNPTLHDMIGGFVRWGIGLVVPIITEAGIWTPDDAVKYTTWATGAIIALGWSMWQKWTKEEEVEVALAASPGTSRAMISKRQ